MMNSNTINPTMTFTTAQNTRADIIGELEAITLYEAHYASTDDPVARATILDIMTEEKLHVGQLFGLLFRLDPVAKTQFEAGLREFNETEMKNGNG